MAQVYRAAAIDAAKIAGESATMDAVAGTLMTICQGLAARHSKTGRVAGSFEVGRTPGKRGVTDRLVVNTDPNAVSIEFGHLTRPGAEANRTPVAGLRIMTRATGRV